MMPAVTIATCFLLVVSWQHPGPVYAGEIQGMVWVDGSAGYSEMRPLRIEAAGPPAIWTAELLPDDRVIERGYVVVQEIPTAAWIGNTPIEVDCERVWLPLIVDQAALGWLGGLPLVAAAPQEPGNRESGDRVERKETL
jgi:hypothetical protein